MKAIPVLALVLIVVACAAPRPHTPVRDVAYSAIGAEPFWLLSIGDDRIVLSRRREGRGGLVEAVYPRTLPREEGGVRRWDSGEGVQVISIEARREECRNATGPVYEDRVRVRLSGVELHGCGGRIVGEGHG